MGENSEQNPKVFISYCQQSKEFSDSVLEFSNKLRKEGIDTVLDQYIQSPDEGWPRWMVNNIAAANFVIMICTEEYNNVTAHAV
jgi:histidyl-tRNA synthetase